MISRRSISPRISRLCRGPTHRARKTTGRMVALPPTSRTTRRVIRRFARPRSCHERRTRPPRSSPRRHPCFDRNRHSTILMPDSTPPISRRTLIAGAAAAAGGLLVTGLPGADAQQPATPIAAPPSKAVPADPTKAPGAPTTAIGERSPFIHPERAPIGEITGTSLTPLQDLAGTLTPADLHFTRIHAGVPTIDPAKHTLLVHGLVDRPIEFSVADLKRFPSVTRTYFIECSGNGRAAYRTPKPDMTPQQVDGMTSNSEWTGVPLRTLFHEAGVQSGASWFLAEGGDASLLARS